MLKQNVCTTLPHCCKSSVCLDTFARNCKTNQCYTCVVAFDAAFIEADHTQTAWSEGPHSPNHSEPVLKPPGVLSPSDATKVEDVSEDQQLFLQMGRVKLPVAYLAVLQ